ncbi:MAG: hypothetical protein J6M93_06395 [Succinivibrio sp.]|nr:hypothetical protein [Succinivibrio sp.]
MRFIRLGVLSLCLFMLSAGAAEQGWSISSSNIWKLNQNAYNTFNEGSPAKIMEVDRLVVNHQARFTKRYSITNVISFKVGCMFQSSTPAFELQVHPLDISITDQFNGFAFARFLIDKGQEFSLRGDFLPPSRLLFAPLSASQEKKLQDLFLQLREGGILKIGLLQARGGEPREFEIPLQGFIALSDKVAKDCVSLNKKVGNARGKVGLLPDYVSNEPPGYAPKDYTLKPKPASDGLTPVIEEEADEKKNEEQTSTQPEVQFFSPGGGPASIGPDGKPIVAAEGESLGTASGGEMQIGEDGSPVKSTADGEKDKSSDSKTEDGEDGLSADF